MAAYLGGFSEELLLTGLGGLLLLLEELLVDLRNINTLDIDLGAGGQGVSLVDSLEGDTIDLVGAGHEQEAGRQLLEEDDTSASEAAGEQHEHAAGGNSLSELGGLDLGALLVVLLLIISGVPCELLDHFL
jgi:hypothetical protein